MTSREVVANLYEAFGQGDIGAVLALLDPGVEWREAEGSPYQPRGEGWIGPDAVLTNLFAKMGEDWAEFGAHPEKFHEAGEVVAVEGRYTGKHAGTGKPLDAQVCHVWTVRGGKIVRFQQYVDTAQMQHVMGVRTG